MKMLLAVRCPQNPTGTVAYAAGLKGEPSTFIDVHSVQLLTVQRQATVEIQISPRLTTCCMGATLSGTNRLLGEGLSASRYRFRGKGRWWGKDIEAFSFEPFVAQ